MYWKSGTNTLFSTVLPFLVTGTAFEATLKLCTAVGESLMGCSLQVLDGSHAGYIFAKRHTDSVYLAIGSLGDSSCFLGDFAEETETEIDFMINIPVTVSDGLIPISVLLVENSAREPFEHGWYEMPAGWQDLPNGWMGEG